MTPAEVSALLVAVRAVDDRIADDDARVTAWAAILDDRVTLAHARSAVIAHYRTETRVIMPADVNAHAKLLRDKEHAARKHAELMAAPRGVPMPDEVRRQLDSLFRRNQ